ncbi:hypothetical protein BJ165DRAFT_1344317, partial [Panaeolus papilionaceus]
FINIGNDRPNVALVVRAIEHSQATYEDLDFIIPNNISKPSDIPLTMVYADSVPQGPHIIQHLLQLIPNPMRNLGLVRPFSADIPLDTVRALLNVSNLDRFVSLSALMRQEW